MYLVNTYFIIYPSIICLSHLFVFYLSLIYLSIIIVSVENMNTIQPTHLPVGSLAVAKVNSLGSLVGCLGVGAPVLSGKINFAVGPPHELGVFK